jgi:hypothetical protein
VNFSEQPPSKQWAALKYRGVKFAEVWFKPADEPFALMFRVRRESFQIPGMDQRLTAENLLKAVAIPAEEVESWYLEDAAHDDADDSPVEMEHPLPPPAQDVAYLTVHINLSPPAVATEETGEIVADEENSDVATPDEGSEVAAAEESSEAVPPEEGGSVPAPVEGGEVVASAENGEPGSQFVKWEDIAGRWRTILGIEASIDSLRLQMESLSGQMEVSAKATLTTEQKLNALNADITEWTRAKTRIHHTTPKVKEFIHRATWVVGSPERKKLGEYFKEDEQPQGPLPPLNRLFDELENLLKDRQVLSAQGVNVYQDCKNITADVQGALRTLLANAARNADRKRHAGKAKGKFFKTVRKWSGAE